VPLWKIWSFAELSSFCNLYGLFSVCRKLYRSLSLLLSQKYFFSHVPALYGHRMKLFEDATFIMDSMNLWFLCTFHYSPSPSPVGTINAMSRWSFLTVKSIYLRHLVLLLSSLLFPLVSILNIPLELSSLGLYS
jgi:hypothetical protein